MTRVGVAAESEMCDVANQTGLCQQPLSGGRFGLLVPHAPRCIHIFKCGRCNTVPYHETIGSYVLNL